MAEIIMAFAPLVFLIVYALKTRKMADTMILATLLAMVLLHRQHFLTGAIDALYGALSNSSYQFVLCITIGFGGMITLFQESGALMGFRDLLLKAARGPKRTLVLAWVMSAVMFVDEYLNALAVTFSMREITDRNRILREHLAVQANVMACCLCMTVPFSSWTAFTVGLVSEYGLGFGDYLRAIPVFVPLALSMGVTAPVIIAAVMSGIGLGYSTCFYANAVFMTTAGTGVSNITIIKATLPYAAGAAAVAAAGFLLCGILA